MKSNVQVMNKWSYTSTPSACIYDVNRNNFNLFSFNSSSNVLHTIHLILTSYKNIQFPDFIFYYDIFRTCCVF